MIVDRDELERQAEAEHRARVRRRVARDAGCPHRAAELVLAGSLRETDARTFLAEPAGGRPLTLLAGPPGVGKTIAAVEWLLLHLPAHGSGDPLFVTAFELTRWPRYDDEQMRRLDHAAAVVVDDLGREYADAKGFFAALLEELVDLRYQSGCPLLVTTNLTAATLWERVGERVRDRWREAGRVFEIRGESLRGRAP